MLEKSPSIFSLKALNFQMDATIFSSVSQVEKLRYAGDHQDFSVMGSVNYRLDPWSLQGTESDI